MADKSKDPGDLLLSLAVAAATGGGVLGGLLWLAGQLSSVLGGNGWPDSTPGDIVGILIAWVRSPADPARAWPAAAAGLIGPAWRVYVIFVALLVPVGAATVLAVRLGLNWRRRRGFRIGRLGFASGWEIGRLMGRRAVLRRARFTRPQKAGDPGLRPQDVGYLLGRDVRSQRRLYSSVEDSMLVLAPIRRGKDACFVTPLTIDAPGACIVISTEPESFTTTYAARTRMGAVHVFDPQNLINWPQRIRLCLVRGCENPNVADDRAAVLAKYGGFNPGQESSFFAATAVIVILRGYLHAAALHGRTIADVVRWARNQTDPEPLDLLRRAESAGVAAAGWSAELEAMTQADLPTRTAMWSAVTGSLRFLSDPAVLEQFSPGPDEVFDVASFVAGRNTLYFLGKETGANPITPATHILMESIWPQIRMIAAKTPGGRVEPPVTVEVNEAGYLAPMSSLPRFMGLVGKSSIAMHVYVRSPSHVRERMGADAMRTMWDNASVRVILGGGGNIEDLEEVSKLLGEVRRPSRATDAAGAEALSRVLTAEEIRTMDFGRAVVVGREARPVEIVLRPWWRRADGRAIGEGKERVERLILQYTQTAPANERVSNYVRSASTVRRITQI
ncbi:TraM recognition domain-containing protein [Dactylosporangium sp. AC04546]|uniref:type IV secretory system conjugative DNA transfer family protein n=1 Tax=Dactylosporangium sp. AC04546 TaxID=2862460 RepID=UPI001EDE3713|nr:TraM recognition domain-containing protein [Dactylosporangium sp. AC04546]WVK89054.1 TraM recognition domain-containing protein [Dactylosporangium sp. AC04546]